MQMLALLYALFLHVPTLNNYFLLRLSHTWKVQKFRCSATLFACPKINYLQVDSDGPFQDSLHSSLLTYFETREFRSI